MDYITEPEKKIPIACDVDVVVAGGGVAGVFAAIAAARRGVRTLLVERFGSVGGNIGPGMIAGGHLVSGRAHEKVSYECTVYPRLYGIGKEFVDRYATLGGRSIPPFIESGGNNYAGDASIASYVAQQMLEENGVRLMLSTAVGDPIMEGNEVQGLFVENKSGRQAVKAGVVIDATGDADVAKRAGAPMLYPQTAYHELDGHAPTGMGLQYWVGGIDWERYEAAVKEGVSAADGNWAEEELGEGRGEKLGNLLPFVRRAHEKGDYVADQKVALDGKEVGLTAGRIGRIGVAGLGHARVAPERVEELDAGSGSHISALEARMRALAFENWYFWKNYVPGFEDSSLLFIAPFLGSRGGPCIEGDYTLTMDDCRLGKRFDDVIYVYGEFRALRYTADRGKPLWVDVPYRVMLPKGIEGLMAVGRSASGKPDTLLRNRMAVKVMGEAGGIAAALAVEKGIAPRALDIGELQRALLDTGFHLGDRKRLVELGLE